MTTKQWATLFSLFALLTMFAAGLAEAAGTGTVRYAF